LLTFSRNVESKLQPTDINSEIKLAHKLLDRSIAGPVMINVGLDLDKDLKYAIADPTQLNQIITNLCINAKDAMPKGGHLTITTRNVELDDLYCKPYDDVIPGKYVRISISDDGEGMPQEVQERIFEPFFTTKEPGKGTGLGLAVVYGIIKSHHGHITVYSAPGRGTEFKIFIPTSNEENAKNEIGPPDIPLIGGTETILIIDDEEAIKAIGKEILERHGYNVIDVDRGEEGLKIYKKNKIDLVLLDLIMPGMSGTRVLKELMKIDPNAKVIVASGYSANGPIRDALGEGAKQFIDKPYTLRQLVTTIRDVLDDKGDLL
jgi:CheY-like chemotaxis protein